ncbi:MAG: sulfatase [Isosphaeraceae bacterium]
MTIACRLAALLALLSAPAVAADRPNVVIIYADDLGYADIGPFGGKGTPNLDRMAAEGIKFTDFYVAQAVCSASRTALLTGCYPNRLGILGALGPKTKIGIADGETTLAEVLQDRGYACAAVGKWHLGRQPRFLPTRHGFHRYFGLPYSNDMWPGHPTNPKDYPDLPLIEDEEILETNPDQHQLTARYTEKAVAFINRHPDRPFFLYLAHSMPHVPLFASPKFEGKTGRGLYADVIAEIDDSVGQVLAALQQHNLDEKTLVIFASDNGPWLSYGDHGGSSGPLREGKGTTFEGGVRVPFLARWVGKIPAGAVCREPAMTIDILPTLAKWVDAPLPDRPIDGRDIGPMLLGKADARSPHEALFFYWDRGLEAVRSGDWKLHFPHPYRSMEGQAPGSGGKPSPYLTARVGRVLYNLRDDPGERTDRSAEHPEVVARLESLADGIRGELGDSLTGVNGRGVREPGRVEEEPR